MTKSEFKHCLGENKKLSDLVRKVAEEKFQGWDCLNFHIQNGKIWATIWSGEDASDIPDALQEKDVTKEVLAELMPDDLIF